MAAAPPTVLDTVTGQVWSLTRDASGLATMARICYRGPGDQLTPTPFEGRFADEPDRFREACTQNAR